MLVAVTSLAAQAGDYPKHSKAGSTYVPLESWIYPAMDRLAALGYIQTAFAGIRPWTRLECARLLNEARDRLEDDDNGAGQTAARELYSSLQQEFGQEFAELESDRYRHLGIEEVYVRSLTIGGPPLTDSYHFGQTVINDYGRPYGRGANLQVGIATAAVSGPVFFYARGEYQHGASLPSFSLPLRELIAQIDSTPVQPPASQGTTNRFEMVDGYAGMNLLDFSVAVGKQSLWWGPSKGGPFLISNNAEPMYMLRIARNSPFKLPWILQYLGPARTDFFLARLSGHSFPARPWIHGAKFSFKPTRNLELGFSRTVVFAGEGHPFTTRSLLRSFFSNSPANDAREGPGDRRVAVDFSYRVPGLRNWLTLYSDSMVDDVALPFQAPDRTALSPGIYLARIPGLPKLDFRAEAVTTQVPFHGRPGEFFYWNVVYKDAYTNNGNLLGSWIGREATGFQLWSTYWMKPQNTVQAAYRHSKVNSKFIPGGGTISDIAMRTDWKLSKDLNLFAAVQYETWRFPVSSTGIERNIGCTVQLSFKPKF